MIALWQIVINSWLAGKAKRASDIFRDKPPVNKPMI
jgi:hypothetical protein